MKTAKIIAILLLAALFCFRVFNAKNKKTPSVKPVLIEITPFIPTPTFAPLPTLTKEQLNTKHQPVTLEKGDVLVSFRMDDVDFSLQQKNAIRKALYLAKKYNITFDLEIIAKAFDKNMDPSVFKIYQDNKDVFEIVAHGYDHLNYIGDTTNGEFGGASIDYQEDHFQKMLAVFNKYHLDMATKIFFTPWHSGDQNTINLAKKYRYQFLTQWYTPNNKYSLQDGNIFVSYSISDFNLNSFKKFSGQSQVEVITHPPDYWKNFYELDKFCQTLTENYHQDKLKFDFVSRNISLTANEKK